MSSSTWTPPAVGSEARAFAGDVWRAVEAQHVASTMALVDTAEEQAVLESLIDEGKPGLPPAVGHLDYLLATPFRYRPPPGGSRFRGENDPGVYYAADAVRTACAELGYWRWRHLLDSPALASMPTKPQTVFRVRIAARAIDLREAPFASDRPRWTHPSDYAACQALARIARAARVQAIRYESVRDPARGGCCAVLDPAAFASRRPASAQTWWLTVTRERVVWRRSAGTAGEVFEFVAGGWEPPPRDRRGRRSAPRRKRR